MKNHRILFQFFRDGNLLKNGIQDYKMGNLEMGAKSRSSRSEVLL